MRETRKISVPPGPDRDHIQVYSKTGLEAVNVLMCEALEMVSDLGGGIHHGNGDVIDDILRQKLLNRPLISRALQRLKTQSAQ